MANAVFIEVNFQERSLRLNSSIVGLPAIFLHENSEAVIVTSDIWVLATLPGVTLRFDHDSIRDMCRIGHPIEHRTLFRGTSMVPGGHSAAIGQDLVVRFARAWRLGAPTPLERWEDYTDLQTAAFRDALRKMDLKGSFLSLTAGLDTRAIVADLVNTGRMLPAYTMSGRTLSLDALTARSICRNYKSDHHVVELRDDFYKNLARCASEASRLSGGLSGLGQAHEIYLYENVNHALTARLSGNLGNQIGRRGTEKISLLNADETILHQDLGKRDSTGSQDHWYSASTPAEDGRLNYEFLLQHEVPYSSVANYSIGSNFAVQLSPYANRSLIESVQSRPLVTQQRAAVSLIQMRLKDLRHRFLGEDEKHSFQILLIRHVGGPVASIPINWGWRAKGGVSFKGLFIGGMAFADALVCSRGWDTGVSYRALQAVHVGGLHEYRSAHRELECLKEYVHDTLLSDAVDSGGLLNKARIAQLLNEHYVMRRYHHKAITLAMDLALAQQNFKASIH
jgi:hypothetical protein